MPHAPTPSRKRFTILCTIMIVLGFTCVGSTGYQIYRTWIPWTTDDINQYPEMRKRLVEIYPLSPDILLPAIPPDATSVQFIASPIGGLRNPPYIDLLLSLQEETAIIELDRLRDIASTRDDFTFTFNDDGIMYFEYRMGSMGTFTRDAVVSYEPGTHTFSYYLGAGY